MKLLKPARLIALLFAAASVALPLSAQTAGPELPPEASSPDELPPFDDYLPGAPAGVGAPTTAPSTAPTLDGLPTAPDNGLPPIGTPGIPGDLPPAEAPAPQEIPPVPDIEEAGFGTFQLTDANLNEVFQLLAESANRQYFHNPRIAGEEFNVTGRLQAGSPLSNMEELAFQYGLEIYEKGNTVYALTKVQMGELPSKEWLYKLRYLRPADIEAIRALVAPYLSPGTGIVNYEPKTNTVVVIDTPQRIEQVESFFREIDKPQGQVVVEVKILSVNSNAASRLGVDWTNTLGQAGLSLSALYNLNSIFGIDANDSSFLDVQDTTGNSNFVLSPTELNGVLRALNEGGLVRQMSNPVVITEDNEPAIVSLIDRVPIITRTVNQGVGGTTVSEEVRYVLDESDPVGDPATTREIGITMAVTPQVLPDGTIRMRMRPRSAQVVGQVQGVDGNVYPEVTEATIETLARIPDGHSLIVGGFFSETETDNSTKIPILGDIPILNFLFKSKDRVKDTASLVFVVTPTSYLPEDHAENYRQSQRLSKSLSLQPGHDHINPVNAPGRAHEADYCRTMRAIQADLARETNRR